MKTNQYEVLNDSGEVISIIMAKESFMQRKHPGRYRLYMETLVKEPSPPPPNPMVVSKIAMITRFTDAEYVGVLTAAKTDVEVEAWVNRFDVVTRINLEDERTISGINLLVSKGLLTEERGKAILETPVANNEMP